MGFSAQPGIKPRFPALEAWNLRHWITREVPVPLCFFRWTGLQQASYKKRIGLLFLFCIFLSLYLKPFQNHRKLFKENLITVYQDLAKFNIFSSLIYISICLYLSSVYYMLHIFKYMYFSYPCESRFHTPYPYILPYLSFFPKNKIFLLHSNSIIN